ncbi:uncharacterized protein [Cardiocondyla obscurior]|uniref:uncharacterized protein n=1 Tax=Cardiocondyla obscurior TaxID=286306 RepID=UPI00396588E3
MHYLLSSLHGSALECVRELSVTAENFEVAWQALNARFEDKRRLVRGHLNTLLNLPTITRESAAELQILIDKLSSTLTSLKNLKRKPKDLWDDMIVHVISQRLDSSSRKAWSVKFSDSNEFPTSSDILEFLRQRR